MPSVKIHLNGKTPEHISKILQASADHHGIQNVAIITVEAEPESRYVSWRERKSGATGMLNRIVGAEQERILAAIAKSGAELASEVTADAFSAGLDDSAPSKAFRAGSAEKNRRAAEELPNNVSNGSRRPELMPVPGRYGGKRMPSSLEQLQAMLPPVSKRNADSEYTVYNVQNYLIGRYTIYAERLTGFCSICGKLLRCSPLFFTKLPRLSKRPKRHIAAYTRARCSRATRYFMSGRSAAW